MTRHWSLLVVSVTVLISVYVERTLTSSLSRKKNAVECKGITLTKIGCFNDNQLRPRPLPELIFTDRDVSSPLYSGVLINWRKWNDYMKSLICRCASKSLLNGYDVMGLQYYGECWSGKKSAAMNYARDGSSNHCIAFDGDPCKGGLDCVGEDHTNFVYKIQKDKAGAPTKKPTKKETTPKKPTPSKTPKRTTPSTTPKRTTPSTTKKRVPSSTPTRRSSSTRGPTPSGSATPTPPPLISPTPTPSGSVTSTAKRPNIPSTSSNPCSSPSPKPSQQPQQPCFPNCQQPILPVQYPVQFPVQYPVLYPAQSSGSRHGCPQLQCPAHCAPRCSPGCCRSFRFKKSRTSETL